MESCRQQSDGNDDHGRQHQRIERAVVEHAIAPTPTD